MRSRIACYLGVALSALAGCATVDCGCGKAPVVQEYRPPVAAVSACAADESSVPLAREAEKSAETALMSAGFEISESAAPDMSVRLDVSRRELARLQDWRAYEGRVEMRAVDASGRLAAVRTIVSAGERGADEAAAGDSLARKIGEEVARAVAESLRAEKIPLPPAPRCGKCAQKCNCK